MDLYVDRDGKQLLLIAKSKDDQERIRKIMLESTSEETKKSRSLIALIPGRLYHALNTEEFLS